MSVPGFQPRTYASADAGSLACRGYGGDAGLVLAYGDACIGHQATLETCAAFVPPEAGPAADCYRCLVTTESPDAGAYGPVAVATLPLINYAACIQATDPTPAGASCALATYQAAACAEDACKAQCPVTDNLSARAYSACWNAAWSSVCSSYGSTANGCIAAERGDGGTGTPTSQVCFGGATAEDQYLAIASLLCGSE